MERMTTGKLTVLASCAFALMVSAAVPSVVNVTANQRYPWNGIMDISYEVIGDMKAGLSNGFLPCLLVTVTNRTDGTCYEASTTALSGDTGTDEGIHHVAWDLSEQGLELESSNVVFTVAYIPRPLYCVIDLSAGANATSYPVSYLSGVPTGGWTDEYKTTKLVLRRIGAGTFIMGSDQADGSHRVMLSKSFFCGVFEVTQKQYELVTGSNPCSSTSYGKGDTCPVHYVTYDMIRGSSDGAKWPLSSAVDSSSFMGRLRARTGLDFDLPTDAQWEYACRAGTTTTYGYGNLADGDYMWYTDNSGSKSHPVGTKNANAWGLYDMHGNVWEWCLDWYDANMSYGTDPKGSSSGTKRVLHGGSWDSLVELCASSYRNSNKPARENSYYGFRLFRPLSNAERPGIVLCDGQSMPTTVTAWSSWQPNSPLSFSDGLAAHYTFDGDANDYSCNGNDGIIHGVTPTVDRHGNADGAYHFDGTSAYIEVADSDSLREVGQTVTISAWVKPETWDNTWVSILCKGYNDTCRQYGPQINKSGKWLLNDYNGTKSNELQARAIELNVWSHVTVTYTPTAITAYINGECIGAMAPLGNMVENSEPLYIGFDAPGGDEYLTGNMDEVRIYNRSLSATEVRALANGDDPVVDMIGESDWVYRYDVVGGVGITQTGFGHFAANFEIPDAIGGKPVVAIGRYGFVDTGDIETVAIPPSVAEIGDSAFAGCSNLSQVTLSSNIRTLTVGGNAFDATTDVTIGNKSDYEFVGWTNAAGVVISDPFHSASAVTVTPVWQRTETATIDGHTWTFIVSEDGRATIGNGTDVAVDPAPVGDLAIPEEIGGHPVIGIGNQAFKECEELTSMTIPSNVTSVGYGAFEGCTGLTNVVIETELIDCVMSGLMQAKFDTRFDITSTLDDANEVANVSGVIAAYTRIEKTGSRDFSDPLSGNVYTWNETNSTFAYFGQMYMDAGKTYVFGAHFDDDTHINVDGHQVLHVVYPETIQKIGVGKYECAISGWHNVEFRLGDIDGVKGSWGNIWSGDFAVGYRDDGSTNTTQSGWSRLLDPGNGTLFKCDGSRTIFAGCSNIVSVTIPWSLVSRMSSMFPNAYHKLESIILTGGTDVIPEKAFADCESLTSVTIPAEITGIGGGAFDACTSLTNIMLPNGIGTLSLGTNVCSVTTTVEMEPINDYFFGGWTNEAGAVVSDPFHSVTAVTISPWWRKVVDLSFNANGGTGGMNAQRAIEGDVLVLTSNAFVRAGYLFQGWSVMANDDVIYVDGTTIFDVPASMDGMTLYAVWKPCTPEITPAEDSVFANASETVALSHDANDIVIFYTTDGSDPREYGLEYNGTFSVYESCTIRVVACGAGRYSDEACVTLTRTEGLSAAVNLYGYLMETDSSNPWTVVTDVSHDGVSCARSGAIGHGGMTWLQTSVRKAGTISFWWKAACEEAEEDDGETYWYDYGAFLVDGVEKAKIAGNDTGWRKVEVEVPSGGKHVFRWEYHKDGATTYSPDCIWLDQVQWIPADGSGHTLTTPEPVPYSWLTSYNLGLDSDFERAAKQPTGKVGQNGRAMSAWQDYVAGTDPTDMNDFLRAMISMKGGMPDVTWTPNLNTNGEVRVYKVWGKADLMDSAWTYPTNSTHRFFKVTVEMP